MRIIRKTVDGSLMLTTQEAAFVDHFCENNDAIAAARHAGYKAPGRNYWQVLERPAVQDAIRMRDAAIWQGEFVVLRAAAIRRGLTAPSVKDNLAAAKQVTDYLAGIGDDTKRKDVSDWTAEELATAVDVLRREQAAKADRARPIEPAPVVIEGEATIATPDASFLD